MADFVETFDYEGVAELMKKFDKIMTTNPDMEKRLVDIIRTSLIEARSKLSRSARNGLNMQSDPREAYRAVRSSVYKRILGGNLNILSRRRAGKTLEAPEALPRTGRGGNRCKRSHRSQMLMSYWGADRGFILRFLNQGTQERSIKRMETTEGVWGRKKSRWVSSSGYGNRGAIAARPWFNDASMSALEGAVNDIIWGIEELIKEQTT